MAAEDEYNLDPDKMYGSREDVQFRLGILIIPPLFFFGFIKLITFIRNLEVHLF